MHQCCCRSAGLPAASLWRPAAKPHAPVAALAARWAGRAPMLDRCSIDRVYLRSIGVAWMAWASMAWPSPGHDEEGTAAERQRTERQRTRRRRYCGANTPCTRTGRRDGQQSSTPDGSLRQAGDRRSGRQASKWNHKCTRHYVANATKDRHLRESGDPSGIGPRFRGDDGVVGDACEPCGVCYIVPDAHRCTRMGWSPACSFRARPNRPRVVSKRGRVGPVILFISVHPWFHLLACVAACRTLLQALADRDAQPRPHAPVAFPGRHGPPSHPESNETMARFARNGPGENPIDNWR